MDREYFRKITTTAILAVLIVLSFLLIKPILLSVFLALVLAFLFYPLYKRINKTIKSKNLSAFLICIFLIILIIIPIWFLTPIIINQSIEIYIATQQMDFVTPLKNIFPSIFASESFSQEIGSTIYSFVTKTTNKIMNLFCPIINKNLFFLKNILFSL